MKRGDHAPLPPGPLLDLLRFRAREHDETLSGFVRRVFGANTLRSVERWKTGEHLTYMTADRICVGLGVHPTDLWPGWNAGPPPGPKGARRAGRLA